MSKKSWIMIFAAMLAAAAVTGCSRSGGSGGSGGSGSSSGGSSGVTGNLAEYAPADTDFIAHINGPKLAGTKIWHSFKQTLTYGEMTKEAKMAGFTTEEVLQGEAYIFFSVARMNGLNYIYKGGPAAKMFDSFKNKAQARFADDQKYYEKRLERYEEEKKQYEKRNKKIPEWLKPPKTPSFSAAKIDDKDAFTRRGCFGYCEFVIMLDKDTIQQSAEGREGEFIATPLKRGSNKLAGAIDTGAIVSIVYKNGTLPKGIRRFLNSEDGRMFRDIEAGLKTAKLTVTAVGGDLELKVVGEYESSDAAKKSCRSLEALRPETKKQLGYLQKTIDVLWLVDAVRIERRGAQVVISLRASQEKLAKCIADWDRHERERRNR